MVWGDITRVEGQSFSLFKMAPRQAKGIEMKPRPVVRPYTGARRPDFVLMDERPPTSSKAGNRILGGGGEHL
ncbi:uncharacterized [Tachysurus ichikawai]